MTPITDYVTVDRITKAIHIDGPATITRDSRNVFIDYIDGGVTVSVNVDLGFLL